MEKPSQPPVVDLSNFEERKDEITKQVMEAAKSTGGHLISLLFDMRYS